MNDLNKDSQPFDHFHLANNAIKAMNILYGLCMGILADGKIDEREVMFLATWLKENEQFLNEFPLNIVAENVQAIISDNKITKQECDHLYKVLGELVGGPVEETGAVSGQSTQLPLNNIDTLVFDEKTYCFTGKFIYGTRDKCQDAVIQLGSYTINNITKKLDYLVIGALSSPDWITASHGRKIEKALHYQNNGCDLLIISEEDWHKHLNPIN